MAGRRLADGWFPRRLGAVPVVLGAAFLLTGCGKVTGGGWIQSASHVPGEKASFGFSARCKNTTVDGVPNAVFYDGQFEYDDHAANGRVRVHGDVTPFEFGKAVGQTCQQVAKEPSPPVTQFGGRYRTQNGVVPYSEGDFSVGVADGGNGNNMIDGDEIQVELVGDNPISGFVYFNTGIVQGGNIQIQ